MSKFLEELQKTEFEKSKWSAMEIVFTSTMAGLILFCFGRGIYLRNDDSLIAYRAPDMREMGAPIRLQKIEELRADQIQNMLHDFVRKYIRALYPQNSKEADFLYKYVVRHTRDPRLLREYKSYLQSLESIGEALDKGKTMVFSPVNSLDVRMRKKKDRERAWIIEVDGFLNNRLSLSEEDRGIVTLRFEVAYDRPSLEGSYSGWYVDKYDILTIRDAVANNVENVKAN